MFLDTRYGWAYVELGIKGIDQGISEPFPSTLNLTFTCSAFPIFRISQTNLLSFRFEPHSLFLDHIICVVQLRGNC